ncbi:uncharacterized protein LOC134543194 [Bacillus rossius redtenbacheri]|uniref:uncharacterized protein LOC134543194 n=1 Tax=Bacillus rossius redtenbacheri TaxID=93214 RepID=UPI002FDE4939
MTAARGLPSLPLAAGLVVLLAAGTASGLKCYSCASDTDTMCNDPFNSRHALTDCESQRTYNQHANIVSYCKKVQQIRNNDHITVRGCAWASEMDKDSICRSTDTPFYMEQKYCSVCSTDGCNSAPGSLLPSVVSVLAPAALVVLLKTA